jgi:hypothetical protein
MNVPPISDFCAPYWPEFRKIDFLRSIRTFQTREYEWQKNTVRRIVRLLGHTGQVEVEHVVRMSLKAGNFTAEEGHPGRPVRHQRNGRYCFCVVILY